MVAGGHERGADVVERAGDAGVVGSELAFTEGEGLAVELEGAVPGANRRVGGRLHGERAGREDLGVGSGAVEGEGLVLDGNRLAVASEGAQEQRALGVQAGHALGGAAGG